MIRKILYFILISGLLITRLPAEEDSCLTAGIARVQNYQFDQAISLFKKASLREPVQAIYLLNTKYKKLKVNGRFKEANTFLIEGVQKHKGLFKKALNSSDPDYAELLLYYGALLGLQSQVYMAESKYLQGYYHGLRGIKKVEAAYEMNPELKDALLAMGTSAFYSGVMAQHYSAVGAFINTDEALAKGIRLIKETWESDARSRAEAGYLLLLIHVYEIRDYEKACHIGKQLVEKYPGNLENRALYAEALIRLNRYDEAEEVLNDFDKHMAWLDEQGKYMWSLRKTYVKAVLAMEKGVFTEAEKKFLKVLENYCFEYKWQENLSLLKLGQMADLKGDRDQAVQYYRQVVDSKETTRSVLDAKKYLETPFTRS